MLVVSMHDESLYAERVLRAGGRGYIMKQEGGKKFLAGHPPGAGRAEFTSAKKCPRASWKIFPAAMREAAGFAGPTAFRPRV